MHDTDAQGNEFFKCDFCRRAWAEELPMVEGHKGSLICGDCLREAFTKLVVESGGETVPDPVTCALCLLHQEGKHWWKQEGGAVACRRCVNQSARILAKDKESGWVLPGKG
ncbi:MAG: hypothetical protein JSR77_14740 [Planctomycetes bacterium]|nr:hypothetical protein [Planctomycetota bacterium]